MTQPHLPDAAFRRLGRRAGIKRFEKSFFEESRVLMDRKLERIINKAILYTEHKRKRTLDTDSVDLALKSEGINLGSKPLKSLNLDIYIYRVLKQTHPNVGITQQARDQLNNLMNELIVKFAREIQNFKILTDKQTIDSRDVQTATRLLLTGDLVTGAVSAGTNADKKFNVSIIASEMRKGQPRAKPQSRTQRAGLTVAPARVEAILRSYLSKKQRMGHSAPIYLTAVIEYLLGHIFELVGNITLDSKRVRINDRDLMLGITTDEELAQLVTELDFVFGYSGVVPHIHQKLIKRVKA